MYLDEDYLKLFEQVRKQNTNDAQGLNKSEMLKETPDYSGYNNNPQNFTHQNLNEVTRSRYTPDINLNEFVIEKRFNDEPMFNMNEVKRNEKQERLNEILKHRELERINEIKKHQEAEQNLNEKVNFQDADVVTLEMFDRARKCSMNELATKVIPK